MLSTSINSITRGSARNIKKRTQRKHKQSYQVNKPNIIQDVYTLAFHFFFLHKIKQNDTPINTIQVHF